MLVPALAGIFTLALCAETLKMKMSLKFHANLPFLSQFESTCIWCWGDGREKKATEFISDVGKER